MKRKLFELRNTREQHLKAAESAIENGDNDGYKAEMEKVKALNARIADVQECIAERDRYKGAGDQPGMSSLEETPEELDRSKRLVKLIGTDSYKRLFCKALRNGIDPNTPNEAYKDLFKAMTLAGGDPAGSDGGFLAPPDFEARVIELSRELIDLSEHVTVIPVNSATGWRNVEATASHVRMQKLAENEEVGLGASPKFKQIKFNCETYGDFIAVSGELMEDADGLLEYLAQWFAKRYVATKNALILDILNEKEAKPIAGESDDDKVKAIKTVLNKDIPTAASKKATILTNQDGYNEMDNWSNELGIPYLKPDVSGDFEKLKNRPVLYGDNALIESNDDGTAPVYIGDLRSAVALFIRHGIRLAVTNVGGSAWRSHGYEVRATCQMDCHEVDSEAVAKCSIAVEA